MISVLKKKKIVVPFSPRYLVLYHLSPAVKKVHIALGFGANKGIVLYVCLKSKIVVDLLWF